MHYLKDVFHHWPAMSHLQKHCLKGLTLTFSLYTIHILQLLNTFIINHPTNISSKSKYCNASFPLWETNLTALPTLFWNPLKYKRISPENLFQQLTSLCSRPCVQNHFLMHRAQGRNQKESRKFKKDCCKAEKN